MLSQSLSCQCIIRFVWLSSYIGGLTFLLGSLHERSHIDPSYHLSIKPCSCTPPAHVRTIQPVNVCTALSNYVTFSHCCHIKPHAPCNDNGTPAPGQSKCKYKCQWMKLYGKVRTGRPVAKTLQKSSLLLLPGHTGWFRSCPQSFLTISLSQSPFAW